ncbi:hypothetical protein C8F04DRAFT_1133126 [Mycena alexandri]|uniref:MYND-type domain-containing protein n=1 Tax=Mycena alexandri TaxID=1745969 RepID=A0AAD6SA95_9AGAR|nr:hypothetical protein C8F04DRAFT_1133126 [Mycena alexandri]
MAAVLAQAIESLADPRNPTFCCRYYICLLSQINVSDMNDNWENPIIPDAPNAKLKLNLTALAEKKSGSLLTAISALVTTYRSREDMAALVQRMEHCECNRTDPLVDRLHAWEWNSAAWCRDPPGWVCRTTTMNGLIAIIADLLFYSLQMHEAGAIPWPRDPRQCLAGDDETAATMLCRWLDLYPVLPILRAIAAVASLFGPRVIVPFLLSAHLPKNLVAILKRGLDALPADYEDIFGALSGPGYPVTLVFITIKEISNIDDGVSSAYFYREHCPLLLQCLNRVAEINARMGISCPMHWTHGPGLGGVIHAKLVLPFDETQYHATILECSKEYRTLILEVQTPPQLALNIMRTLTEMPPQCMHAHCAKSTAASLCTGCRRVAYCDAECQKNDWNGSPLPHKKVCKTIRTLADASNFPIYTLPKSPSPEVTVDLFWLQVRAQNLSPGTVNTFSKYMIEDDRIRKVVNDKYSARYQRCLD